MSSAWRSSFVVAARDNRHSDKEARDAAVECVRAYREHLRECSKMSPLEVWYDRLDAQDHHRHGARRQDKKISGSRSSTKAHQRIGDYLYPKITAEVGGRRRLVDQPPVLFHVTEKGAEQSFREAMAAYRLSLPDERRVLFDRYRLEDFAIKVVGIGSVGTRCFVGLFFSAEGHPLLLQFKEACPLRARTLCGQERLRESGTARRRGATADAVRQRHLSGLDAGPARATISSGASCGT